ncbi:response regulator [Flavobacterium buctense]|uniref:Response regulator n=1 Tax=Flavobacterium buctense TaxID=1648146 RepID=A0ABU9E418_9FLAO|nr:response regulator [Flavobacterium buctense]
MIKSILSFFSKKNEPQPVELSPLKELTTEEFEKSKFKARIAFIDDEEISHIKRLQSDGYNITQFTDIDNIDDFIRKKYHVVVLDIQGIGQNIAPKTEGWGILKYLKSTCPNTVVIMYTGAEWSITKYKAEADEADDFIGKDLEFLDFKAKLDDGIKKAFSPNYHFEIEKKLIAKEIVNANTLDEIKLIIDNYGGNKKVAMSKVKELSSNSTVLERIDNLLSITDSITNLL